MPIHDSNYLIERLLSNTLSAADLDAFLVGLHDAGRSQVYSNLLEAHFNKLLPEYAPNPTILPISPGNRR